MGTEKTWSGLSLTDIYRGKGPWSFSICSVEPSRYHYVLYKLPVNLQHPPKPHQSSQAFLWDNDHVRMPFSEENLYPLKENGTDVIKLRWTVIKEALSLPINSVHQFEAALNKYNMSLPKFQLLHYFFSEVLQEDESQHFFKTILPRIIKLALRLPELIPCGIPLLAQNRNRSLSLSQLQVSCLLANAFLCTFPYKKSVASRYPGVNFISLYSSFERVTRRQCICEKIKCILNYFDRITQQEPTGVVTFERKMIPWSSMPKWNTLEDKLGDTRVHISSTGTIEDASGFLQVDFANKNIGGGVLRYGCVQEEIRFVICPELIVSRLFIEQLNGVEAVKIIGVERYSSYTGYGDTFRFSGNFEDGTPHDLFGRRRTSICVIDATKFNKPRDQFQGAMILREVNKAYVGFSCREKENVAPIATGNWGCGAFNGSKQLKTLIQLIACTAAKRDLVYYSFDDEDITKDFYEIYLFLANNQVTIKQLWSILGQFTRSSLNEEKLYPFIKQAYFDSKKQPTISKYFTKEPNSKRGPLEPVPSPSTSKTAPLAVNRSPEHKPSTTNPKKTKLEEELVEELLSSLSEDIIPSSQPETPVMKKFTKLSKVKTKKSSETIVDMLPDTDISAIFDMLDGNANKSESTKEEEKMEIDDYEHGHKGAKNKITDYFNKINK